ncbi:pyridoxal phosphate-dependent aminotransferase [Chitinimonas lacunae]|uniref:Histidinol-phosphate aminotransferase n=1 Tax=Chitinimonas lacunae TaxID=1963018 RepID=A0ABV8ML94_9NEIS
MLPASRSCAAIGTLTPRQTEPSPAELARQLGIPSGQLVQLARNENPLGCSPQAHGAVLAGLNRLHRYPDTAGTVLKQTLATRFGLSPAHIVLGNGSCDLLDRVSRTFLSSEHSAVYAQYGPAAFPRAIRAMGATAIEVRASDYGHDLMAMLAAIRSDTRLVLIANPNDPTGTLCRPGDIVDFLERCPPEVLVVLDEAYVEFVPAERRVDSLGLLHRFPNLLLCRTLSHAYGLASLRIGFALCSPELAEQLDRLGPPFPLNGLAEAAALAALDDAEFLAATRRNNEAGLAQIGTALLGLGLPFIPGNASFLCFHVGDGALLDQFLRERGVLVRLLTDHGLPDSLRVSIGLPAENARFIEVMNEALA